MNTFKLHAFIIALLCLCGCRGNVFTIDGTIDGAADGDSLALELSENGNWWHVANATIDKNGNFHIEQTAPDHPCIYRLRLNNAAVCFPIDSLDRLTLHTTAGAFATAYTLDGSDHARQMMTIDKGAMRFTATGAMSTPQYAQWKDSLARQIVTDPAGIVAYYAINKYIGNQPVFDPLNDDDMRIIGAVANSFYSFRPDDPRTNYLVGLLTDAQHRRHTVLDSPGDTIYLDETSLIDIRLQDYNGREHALSEQAKAHRIVLLNFTAYDADYSPIYNKLLNDIYTAHAGRVGIFQVGLDTDAVTWREAAKNLPWTTVYDPMGVNSASVGAYQVFGLPTTFIIADGEVVERVEDGNNLKRAVERHLR